jgi:curved DNA-binding protein CbpA
MATVRDLYRVLGVRRSATVSEIKAAFRKKAQLYHPDHNPGKEEWANNRLKAVVEAFEVLSTPAKRGELDRQLALRRRAAGKRVERRQTGRSSREAPESVMDLVRRRAPGSNMVILFSYAFIEYF